MSKVIAIVQARMGSMRLPGKVMEPVLGSPLIEILLRRLLLSRSIDQIVLATTVCEIDNSLANHVQGLGFDVWRGSERNVIDRYYKAAVQFKADVIVRITGDCPIIDYEVVDKVVKTFMSSRVDYVCNIDPPTWPDGLDVEVFSFEALSKAWILNDDEYAREHVTTFIRENDRFLKKNVTCPVDLSMSRWTVDEPEDLLVVRQIVQYFHPNLEFTWRDVMALESIRPDIFFRNTRLSRR